LVSNEGKILTSAINSNSTHKTHHAEINLIRDYCARNQKKLPVGARIYTTLKPCKMCAGMIWEHAEDLKKIAVYFFENDLGSFARSTVLNPGSFERNRATLDPLLRKIQLEWQIGI
jgi:tRNA(Arg) A34 adenosine deaminase TadA